MHEVVFRQKTLDLSGFISHRSQPTQLYPLYSKYHFNTKKPAQVCTRARKKYIEPVVLVVTQKPCKPYKINTFD